MDKAATPFALSMQAAVINALRPAERAKRDGSLRFHGDRQATPKGAYDMRAVGQFLRAGMGLKEYTPQSEAFRVNIWRAVKALLDDGRLKLVNAPGALGVPRGKKHKYRRWVSCANVPARSRVNWKALRPT